MSGAMVIMPNSTIVSYATWLANCPVDNPDFSPILRRVGFKSLENLSSVYKLDEESKEPLRFDHHFPFLDKRTIEGFQAIAAYVKHSSRVQIEFLEFLIWSIQSFSCWNVDRHINVSHLLEDWTFSVLKSSSLDEDLRKKFCRSICNIFESYSSAMLSETQDLDVCCKMIGGILEGMMRSFHNVCPESVSDILSTGINLLNSELLDLRQFLKDVPSNSTVDEILQKHYGLLRTLLGLLYIILEKTDESNRNEGFELKSQALREILLEYYQSIVLFLTRTNSDEVFLCSVTSLCIDIICLTIKDDPALASENFEFITNLLKSMSALETVDQFTGIVDPLCKIIYTCAIINHDLLMNAVQDLKELLLIFASHGSDSRYPLLNQAIATMGNYIGKALKLIIEEGNRVFSESFVSNLTFELPSRSTDKDIIYLSIINALGSISMGSDDEKITKICLSTLIAQFKSKTQVKPDMFYEQMNLIATSGPVSYLNAVLDIYTEKFTACENILVSLELTTSLKVLAELNRKNPVKNEVILQIVMKLFVDKGLQIIKMRGDSSRKKDSVYPPPAELELLLPIIGCLLEETNQSTNPPDTMKVEAFQEFWFIMIFTGFEQSLSWSPTWAPYITTISLATPVLIQHRDRLKTVTTPLSKVLLSQSVNSHLKSSLMSLMPNSGHLSKSLTLPKCLWLLSFFLSEIHKVRSGNLDDLMTYLSSEAVVQFELAVFVDDLASTLLKRWITEVAPDHQAIIDKFSCVLVKYCCHVQERVHNFALRFLKMILDNHKQTYSCHALWEAMLRKIATQYKVCRREVGEQVTIWNPQNLEVSFNPAYNRVTFENVTLLARNIFSAAATEYPHDFFTFTQTSLRKHNNCFELPGDRDPAVVELLRTCIPNRTEIVPNYLNLLLEFQGKSEDHLKWLSFKALFLDDSNSLCDIDSNEDLSKLDGRQLLHKIYCGVQLIASNSIPSKRSETFRYVMEIPFLYMSPLSIKVAICCWAWFLETCPQLSEEWLCYLIEGWRKHVRLGCGVFGLEKKPSIFSRKMSTSPTVVKQIVPQSSPAIPYIMLLDYLHERLSLSGRRSNEELNLFYTFTIDLLTTMTKIADDHRMRPAIYKCAIFGFEFLNKQVDMPFWKVCHLKSTIYTLLIKVFEGQPSFLVEDGDFLKYHEYLIVRVKNYFSEEPESLATFMKLRNDPHSHLPSMEIVAKTSDLIRLLLNQELEKLLIWSNRFKNRQQYLSESVVLDYVGKATKISALLGIRVCQNFTYIQNAALLAPFKIRLDESIAFDHPDVVDFYIKNKLSFNIRKLIYAPPYFFISAIDVFKNLQFKDRPIFSNYSMRSVESCPPETLYFYIPQFIQALRHDNFGYVERTIMHIARSSTLFAHQIIWCLKANTFQDDLGEIPDPCKDLFEETIQKVTKLLAGTDREFSEREFKFFEKVTNISRLLKPFVRCEKWEKKQKIDEELAKIEVDPGVYLPSNPESIVIGIDYKSGRPLQSQAKTPFMATFQVKSADGDTTSIWQSVIFKVGDDCRQDVLALQLLTTMKNIFESIGLNLYYCPYRVVATAPGCGVIEVIPNSISRDMLGREKINSLHEYFLYKFGNEKSLEFQRARENFVKSMAAYSLAGYLFAIRDRHNGNIMVSDFGHIIHIDFGFILDIAPGGVGFSMESPFKLTTEMLQVMGGKDESPYFAWFRELCIQGFLACRLHADKIVEIVELMLESGLPCFKGESTLRRLRSRFRLDLNEADARQFFDDLIYKSCETFRTMVYDRYQENKNGIPY